MILQKMINDWVSQKTKREKQYVLLGVLVGVGVMVLAYHLFINKGLVIMGLTAFAIALGLIFGGPNLIDSKINGLLAEESICPDEVLVQVAESEDVPENVKTFLANYIASNQQVTNGLLYQIDQDLKVGNQIQHSKGHQELLRYRDNA
ncbi:hypothetical protein KAM329D_32240 [Aeromonas caviae]|uniref:hypothetical protein n=1 Tax=Aeromonas caviae TaxID=648 RepID=UPI0018A495BE|nr:hypothetical protein [Aeromonas caviae]BCM78159.1 hypothetical protein KAM329_47110 [Aeromonas caviae]GJA15519.1 hypothetical protein KAM335_27150 [Aeromonas caviae]GJA25621.1 hypothetical protein KAM337_41490 [Aeromonas caviae]GJC24243.1 hypothetical protein KAM329D_32240 [Aeromonas caviae]